MNEKNTERTANQAVGEEDERNKGVIFKNCAPFTDRISEINNTQVDNAKDLDLVMPMYNLLNTVIIFQKHQKVYGNIKKMADSKFLRSKVKITGSNPNNGNTNNVKIAVPLKYLNNFWRTNEMSLINFDINLILTWSSDCVLLLPQLVQQNSQ